MKNFTMRVKLILSEMEGEERGKLSRLGKIAKCARNTVTHWISGDASTMNYEHAKNIESELGYNVDWILNGKKPKKKSAPADHFATTTASLSLVYVDQQEVRLLTLYRESTPMGRAGIEIAAEKSPKLPSSIRVVSNKP